jgi:hypothetical protein
MLCGNIPHSTNTINGGSLYYLMVGQRQFVVVIIPGTLYLK